VIAVFKATWYLTGDKKRHNGFILAAKEDLKLSDCYLSVKGIFASYM
jgi:hypothetical protein